MTNPSHAIDLYVDEKLDIDNVKLWYAVIKKCVSENVVTTDFEKDDDGVNREYKLRFKQVKSGKWKYTVPLTRPLAVKELEKIVARWNGIYDESLGDFIIEGSVDTEVYPMSGVSEPDDIPDVNDYILRGYHHEWMQDMIDKGWRYASEYSKTKKTHPLLRPWDNLSNNEKKMENILPDNMKDLIED